ncbi:MAG TPA: hypothetical protein VFL66_05570 [Gaiellaceae bacterium]|nr:hypothetical protein [Gaiellaceae bacterium]
MTAADRLETWAERLSRRNGWRRKLAAELEEDAAFLRRLDPAAMRARLTAPPPADAPSSNDRGGGLRGRVEAEREEARELLARMKPRELAARATGPDESAEPDPDTAETQRIEREPASRGGDPRQALLVLAVCFTLGVLLAKLVDWRGHAHPRS